MFEATSEQGRKQAERLEYSLEPNLTRPTTCRPPRKQFESLGKGNGKSKRLTCTADAHKVITASLPSAMDHLPHYRTSGASVRASKRCARASRIDDSLKHESRTRISRRSFLNSSINPNSTSCFIRQRASLTPNSSS